MCEANVDEESRERTTVAAAEATTDREAATEQTKKSTRNHEDNERVLRDTNARKKTYIRKTKNIYAYICEDEEEEREFKKLTLHKWNADAAEGDELRVRTRNEGKDEK